MSLIQINQSWSSTNIKSTAKKGGSCSVKNQTLKIGKVNLVCSVSEKKLIWSVVRLPKKLPTQPLPSPTPSGLAFEHAPNAEINNRISSSLYAVQCGDDPETLTTGVGSNVTLTDDLKTQGFLGVILISGLTKTNCDKAGQLKVIQNFTTVDAKWVSSEASGLGILAVKKSVIPLALATSLPAAKEKVYAFAADSRGAGSAGGTFNGISGDASSRDVSLIFNFAWPESLITYAVVNSGGFLVSLGGFPLSWFCGGLIDCPSTSGFLNFLPNARKIQTPIVLPKKVTLTSPTIQGVEVFGTTIAITFLPSRSSDNLQVINYVISLSANGTQMIRNFLISDTYDNEDGSFTTDFPIFLESFHNDFRYTGAAPNVTIKLYGSTDSPRVSSPQSSWNLGLSSYEEFNW